jgi:hypothetical protein
MLLFIPVEKKGRQTRNHLKSIRIVSKHWKKPNKSMRAYIRMGIPKRMAYSWPRSRKGGWAQACSPMMSTTVTISRLKRRGYIVFSEYYQTFYAQLNPMIQFS